MSTNEDNLLPMGEHAEMRKAYEERIKDLEGAISQILIAADSELASGGDMWWACEVREPVERARAILNKRTD